ncbi:MAG: fibronectin type III domain-containing protein [Paludibacteraceae bacterium]|nr:fibronectin type III domain-containing protein [Paludibacteraceae bacterium]
MKKLYSVFVLFTLLFCYTGNVWGETLHLGSNSSALVGCPVYATQADRMYCSQTVYPAASLATMKDKSITHLTYFLRALNPNGDYSSVQIRLLEVDYDILATSSSSVSFKSIENAQLVFEGALPASTTTDLEVKFSKPFSYSGGNLLVDVRKTVTGGSYAPSSSSGGKGRFQGTSVTTYVGLYAYGTTFPTTGTPLTYYPDITFTYEDGAPVTCPKPTALTLSSVSTTSATFSWIKGNEETSWQYICLPADDELNWENATTTTDTFAIVNGLSAETAYKFYVRTDCGSEQSDAVSKQFTTPCVSVTDIEAYGFEDVTAGDGIYNIPDCWSRIAYETAYLGTMPYVYKEKTAAHSGNNFLYFYGGGSSSSQIIVLQPITSPNELAISFWYKNNAVSSSYAKLQIGYMTNPEDAETFTTFTGGTLEQMESYYQVESFLLSEAPSSSYIAIRYSGGSSAGSAYIDDITVSTPLDCYKPASLDDAEDITSSGASFSWTASGHGETQYQYVCVPVGETPNWSEATLTSSTSADVSGLASNSNYTFYVRSYCGVDDQSTAQSKTFHTLCAAVNVPFVYGFEDRVRLQTPECWNLYPASYYNSYVEDKKVHSGTKSLFVSAGKTDANRAVVVLPEMNAALNGLGVSFYYRGTANATIEVGYVTDPEDKSTFVKVGDALTAANAYKKAVTSYASLGAVSGNIAFRFKGTATGDGDFYIDDISVRPVVTLADATDNSTTLASLNGQTVHATIGRTIFCDGDYNTLCLPFSLPSLEDTPLEDATVYAYKYAVLEPDELQVRIYETENGIQAGVPYLLKITAESDMTNMTFSDVIITAAEGKTIGKDEAVEFIGILKPEAFTAGDESTLFVSTGNNLAWASESAILKSFRAFFKRTASAPAPLRPGMRARIVVQEEVVTGVDGTQGNDVQCIKLIENEQLVIIRNGVKYNVQGQIIR